MHLGVLHYLHHRIFIQALHQRLAGANLNGTTLIGTNSIINTGIQKLMIYGNDNSTIGPHIQIFTGIDNYPLFQMLNLTHNNIMMGFDTYFDGSAFRSSHAVSNFQIGKNSNQLRVLYNQTATAQGSVVPMLVASYWDVAGNFVCNQSISGPSLSLSAQPTLMMSASTYMSVSTATDTKFTGYDTTDYTTGTIGFGSGTATVPSLGTYMVCVEMSYDANGVGTGNYDEVWIVLNGSTIYGRQRTANSSGNIMYLYICNYEISC